MNIKVIETYRLDGHDFGSLKMAQTYLENEIGKIIDSTPLPLGPRDRLAIFDAIVKNKTRLCELLTVEDPTEYEEDGQDRPTVNLLDKDL